MAIDIFTWSAKTPGTLTKRLREAAYSPSLGRWCVVGDYDGSTQCVCVTSDDDGDTWTERSTGYSGSYFLGITWGNGMFVAVGGDNNTTTSPAIYTSADGITWTSRTLSKNSRYLWGVIWTGTSFVACGRGGALATSSDGITWTQKTVSGIDQSDDGDTLYRIDIDDSDRIVVANNTSNIFYYSDDDGANWAVCDTSVTTTLSPSVQAMKWTGSCWVAFSNYYWNRGMYGDSVNRILTSADGYTWIEETDTFTLADLRPPKFYSMATDRAGEAILVGNMNPAYSLTGTSGNLTWTQLPDVPNRHTYRYRGGAYGNGNYVVCGDANYYIPVNGGYRPLLSKGAWASSVAASSPSPASQPYATTGTNITPVDAVLSWTPVGIGTHSVYLGTNPDNMVFQGNIGAASSYDPGGLDYNTGYWWRIDTIDGGTTYTGQIWHFVTVPQSQATDEATIYAGTSSLTSVTYEQNAPSLVIYNIDKESLIHGHRYLVIKAGKWYCQQHSRGVESIYLGDPAQSVERGANPGPWEYPNYNYELYQHTRSIHKAYNKYLGRQNAAVIVPVAGEDIIWQYYGANMRRYQCYMMAIDLDSPGMVEGVDWISINQNHSTEPPVSWTDIDNASITFTPDGYSDYLVLATSTWYCYDAKLTTYYHVRLYDDHLGELVRSGFRAYDDYADYQHSHIMQWVLESPEAEERRVFMQYYHQDPAGDVYNKLYGTALTILRLSKFEKVKIAQNRATSGLDKYIYPYSANQQDSAHSLVKFTPDSGGKVAYIFGAQSDPSNYNNTGAAFSIYSGGTRVYTTCFYPPGGEIISNDWLYAITYDGDHRVPNHANRLLTERSGDMATYVHAATKNSADVISNDSLVVFGTKFLNSPQVFNFHPGNGAKTVAKTEPISFMIRGPNGVDKNTINVSIRECNGWEEYNTGQDYLRDAVYANGLWVAGGLDGAIVTSPDGYNWTSRTSGVSVHLFHVAYGNGMWVIAGNSETFVSSPDGINWTDRKPAGSGSENMYGITFGGGQFVSVGSRGVIWTSPDGVNWTDRTFDALYRYGVAYDSVNSLYCTVGRNGIIHTSADAITWTSRSSGTYETIYSIDHDQQGRWIATLLYTHQLLTSTNGISWSLLETYLPTDTDLRQVRYGQGRWVITATNGLTATSLDGGTTWYQTKTLNQSTLNSVAYGDGVGWMMTASNGSVVTSPNAGLTDLIKPAVVDGIVHPDFMGPGYGIDHLDGYDGYEVSLVPFYPTFEKNSLLIVNINADDHHQNSMDEFESIFYNVDGHMAIKQYTYFDAPPKGWTNLFTFPAGTFTAGHRYLLFLTGVSRAANYYGHEARLEFRFNGSTDYSHRGRIYPYSGYECDQSAAMFVREMSASDLVEIWIYIRKSSYPPTAGNIHLVALDLDSDPGSFAENDNWFYVTYPNTIGNMDTTWTNNVGASLTFTPDGTSDYLVLGSVNAQGSSSGHKFEMRLYDSISGELIETTNTSYSSSTETNRTLTYVLAAPSATERTISIQMRGQSTWDHDDSTILVIKMDSFVAKDWAQTTTQQNGFTADTDTVVETLSFNSDARKYTLIMGTNDFQDLARQEFDVDGSNVFAQPFNESDNWYFGTYSSHWHRSSFGIIATNTKETSTIDSVYATDTSSLYLYRRNLIALGTQFHVPPPTKAANPDPAHTEIDVALDKILSWDPSDNAITYDVYFGTDPDPSGNFIGNQVETTFDPPGLYLELAQIYYWRVDAVGDGGTVTGDTWQFTTALTVPPPTKATSPNPGHDDTDVSVDAHISWTPGTSFLQVSHDIYFGKDANPDGNFIRNQAATSYDPGVLNPKTYKLDANTDYYWRIDERNVGGATEGDIWHFTTEYIAPPAKATLPDPGDTQTQVIPDTTLVWTAGAGTISHDVYFGKDPDPSGNYVLNTTSTQYDPPVDMDLDNIYYWRVDEVGPGGTTTGDIWQFVTLEALPYHSKASDPSPADGARLVKADSSLSWSPGTGIPYIGSVSHDVYFGTDPDPSGNFVGNFAQAAYNPGLMQYSTTYYWRVDEVRERDPASLPGDVWSFTTAPIYVTAPRDGDKVYDTFEITGQTNPFVGVHAEVHAGRLIGDGYTTTDENGDFTLQIFFGNQSPGTKISLVMVTQASPDSEEVVINLIQSREPLKVPQIRTGRRVNADANTIALWRFGETIKAPYGGSSKGGLNFQTDGLQDPPEWWVSYAPNESFKPTFQNGIMTTHHYSVPGVYSRIQTSRTDPDWMFDTNVGFIMRLGWRQSKSHEHSPYEDQQPIAYIEDNLIETSLVYDSFGSYTAGMGRFYLGSYEDFTSIEYPYFNKYDWVDLELRGYTQVSGVADTCYMQLYVNDTLYCSSFPDEDNTGARILIGSVFTNGNYTSSDFGYYFLYETNPFIEKMGTNVQGNSERELFYTQRCATVIAGDGVPSTKYSGYLKGSSSYFETTDSAFDVTGAFTVEGWIAVHQNSLGSERVIFGKQARNGSGWCLRVNASTDNLEAVTYNGSENVLPTIFTVKANTWHHVGISWDGSNITVYANGDIVGYSSMGYTANTSSPFRVGSYSDATESLYYGRIYDVRFSNIARSAWEMHNTYNAVTDPQEGFVHDNNTIFVWNFDDDDGHQITTSSAEETITGITSFVAGDYEKYFRPAETRGASTSVTVTGGKLRVATDFESGVWMQNYLYTPGRLKLKGDFDISIDADLTNWPSSPPSSGTNSVRLMVTASSTSTIQLLYEQYTSQSTRVRIHTSNTGSSGQVTSIAVPDKITFRIVREGSRYYGYYGVDGAPATNYLGNGTAPPGDCYIRLYHHMDESYSPSGTYYVDWDNLQVKGHNDYESDGYLFYDKFGGDGYWSGAVRASAIGKLARDFDGTDDFIQLPHRTEWDHRDISVEMWFMADSLQDSCLLSRYRHDTEEFDHPRFLIELNSDGTITVTLGDTGAVFGTIGVNGGVYTAGAWHYLAVTYDDSSSLLSLFIDGRMVGKGVISPNGGYVASASTPIDVGRNGGTLSDYFDGAIGSVRFSDVARTPKEVFDTYHGTNIKEGK